MSDFANQRRFLYEGCLVVLAYCVLAWALLYPLFAEPGRQVFDSTGRPDGWLTAPVAHWAMWAMAWDWHALTSDAWRLFDANIFHPTPHALATSQPLVGQLALFAPVYAVSGNMVLGYQLNLLVALGLCGATMFALLRHWGVGRAAAFFAGFVYAFCPIRLANLTHVQVVTAQYLPLVLLFMDKTLLTGRLRHALALTAFLLLQVLCSEELAYVTLIALIGYAGGVLWHTRARVSPRAATLVVVAVAISTATAYGLRTPRLHLAEAGLIAESDWLSWARLDSSGWLSNYVVPSFAARRWKWMVSTGPSLYVGMVPLALALLAVFGRRREPVAAGMPGWALAASLGTIAVSYLMALGPEVGIAGLTLPTAQGLAALLMPDFSTSATPAKFGLVLMAGFAALAGIGLQDLLARISPARRIGAVMVLVTAATAVEYELPFTGYPTRAVEAGRLARPVYAALAGRPSGAVLEVPAVTCDLFDGDLESIYTASSAAHWLPLLNGYGNRTPLTQEAIIALAESLPDSRATALLGRMTGLRYVVVHLSRLRHSDRRRWSSPPGLRLIGFFGSDLLFEVAETQATDLQAELTKAGRRDVTLLGAPLAPLPPQGQRAHLVPAGELAEPISAGLDFKVAVQVTNRSDRTWPALVLAPGAEQGVTLAYRWEDQEGRILAGHSAAAPLPYDLAPGDSVVASLCVPAPGQPGVSRLVVGLAQGGEWFPDTTAAIPVTAVPLGF